MARSQDLQNELETLCENVYFQPPETVKLVYPCIVYTRATGETLFANNRKFYHTDGYELTVIDRDPDRELADKVFMHFTSCREDRSFVSDNLYHNVYTLYY